MPLPKNNTNNAPAVAMRNVGKLKSARVEANKIFATIPPKTEPKIPRIIDTSRPPLFGCGLRTFANAPRRIPKKIHKKIFIFLTHLSYV
jgi:hypothetical protein